MGWLTLLLNVFIFFADASTSVIEFVQPGNVALRQDYELCCAIE